MPNRIGNVYPTMIDPKFIENTIREAASQRNDTCAINRVLNNIDNHVKWIQNAIITRTWTPSKPKHKTIREAGSGKIREIDYVPFFPDCCMCWILVKSVEKQIMNRLDPFCLANVKGKGPHNGLKYVTRWIQEDQKHTKYGGEADIHHCFESFGKEFVKYSVRLYVKDSCLLWLADTIIDGFKGKGLPIGYPTSHWFANISLTALDRLVRSMDGVDHYYRYVDNIHIFGSNKRKLHKALFRIIDWLHNAGLSVNNEYQIYRIDDKNGRCSDGLGYKVYRSKVVYRKRGIRKFRRIILRCKYSSSECRSILCREGQLHHANMYNWSHKYLYNTVNTKLIRRIVRNDSREIQRRATLSTS